MPIYEYRAEEDGQVIELIRPISDADEPVDDPNGNSRHFTRIHSAFSVGAQSPTTNPSPSSGGGCCPCGDPNGPCNL